LPSRSGRGKGRLVSPLNESRCLAIQHSRVPERLDRVLASDKRRQSPRSGRPLNQLVAGDLVLSCANRFELRRRQSKGLANRGGSPVLFCLTHRSCGGLVGHSEGLSWRTKFSCLVANQSDKHVLELCAAMPSSSVKWSWEKVKGTYCLDSI
jgi:hypothetical protein